MGNRPWVKNYDEGVPETLAPYDEKTWLDLLKETAAERPDHPMAIFKGRAISYGEIEKLSSQFGSALTSLGVKKSDRVAILLPNCPQTIIAQFGAWKAGAVAAMINPLYTEDEVSDLLDECGAEWAVVLTPFYQKVKSIQAKTQIKRVIATNIKEYLPSHLRLLFTLFKEKKEGHRVKLQPNDLWFLDVLERGEVSSTEIDVQPDDFALLLFTGGTTGTPKGALGTHGDLYKAVCQLHAWFKVELEDWKDTYVGTFPMFHVAGNVAVAGTALKGRNPLILVPNPRDLDDLIKIIKDHRPAVLPGVPTLFTAMLKHEEVVSGNVDFSSVKICISGAAPLLAELKKRFDEITGGSMIEGYALTESMMAGVFVPVKGTYKEGSVGLPLPDVLLRIVDVEDDTREMPFNEVGEILIQAPQIMWGYWNRPDATKQTLKDGWLHTGDMGYLDEDGYLFIVDRKKDLIKPSGFQVWPREVEEVIAEHPAVAEVGVAGIADEYQGEAIKAWIVLHEGKKATPEEIVEHCKSKLAGYKVPKQVVFRDSLPKSPVGKILRRELAAEDES